MIATASAVFITINSIRFGEYGSDQITSSETPMVFANYLLSL